MQDKREDTLSLPEALVTARRRITAAEKRLSKMHQDDPLYGVAVGDLFRAQRDLVELLDAQNARRWNLLCQVWPEIELEQRIEDARRTRTVTTKEAV